MASLTHERINEIASGMGLSGWQRAELHRHLTPHLGGVCEVRATAATKFADKVQAAKNDASRAPALVFAEGQMKQIGLDGYTEILNDAGDKISIARLDKVLASAKRPALFAINLKTALARAGLLD